MVTIPILARNYFMPHNTFEGIWMKEKLLKNGFNAEC